MKHSYNIKLNRTVLFKMVAGLFLLQTLGSLFIITEELYVINEDIGLYNYFFVTSFSLEGIEFVMGIMMLIELFLFYILSLVCIFLFIVMLFFNKIIVCGEYIKIQFAPRYIRRFISLKSINGIIPIQSDEISLFQRISNFNFSKKNLYKITTKYNETIIISCVDKSGLERLKTIIKTQTQGDGSSVSNEPNN